MGDRSAGQITDERYRRRRFAFPVFLSLPVVEVDEVVGDMVLPHEGGQFLGRAGHSDEEGGAGLEEDHRSLRHPGKRCVVEHDGAQGGSEELLHQGVRPQLGVAAVTSDDLGGLVLLTQPHDVVPELPQAGRAGRVGAKTQKGARTGSPSGCGGPDLVAGADLDAPIVLPGGQNPAPRAEGQGQPVTALGEEERVAGADGSQGAVWHRGGDDVAGLPVVGDPPVTEQVHASPRRGAKDWGLQHCSGAGAVVHQSVDAEPVESFSLVLDGKGRDRRAHAGTPFSTRARVGVGTSRSLPNSMR